ncbi:TetR/AcrR family transcriptional regulator [Carnobacterium gallinarum]|uniref:TetR/AcrR family transcriptional regulator n=1 Tax=Carnobacterium gallinarum TaxID=2749 RepID=UPI00055488D5|nr:TetR/AcrR family transcriptional regulator [Carnobacterium gallinarum]
MSINKTKKDIQNALLKLLSTQTIEQITVKQIAHVTFISRTYFYNHFKDKYDVMQSLVEDYLTSIQSLFTKNHDYLLIESFTKERVYELSYQNTVEIMDYLKSEQQNLIQLIKKSTFKEQLYDLYYQHFIDAIPQIFIVNVNTTIIYYITQGIFQIYMNWLEHGCQESIEDLSTNITNLLMISIEQFPSTNYS